MSNESASVRPFDHHEMAKGHTRLFRHDPGTSSSILKCNMDSFNGKANNGVNTESGAQPHSKAGVEG